jgi:hypothetical protein
MRVIPESREKRRRSGIKPEKKWLGPLLANGGGEELNVIGLFSVVSADGSRTVDARD